jgi:hypothetical protein
VVLAALACGGDGDSASPTATVRPATPVPTRTPEPGVADRVTLAGALTVDGAPLDTQFLGARVLRDGLTAACQAEIPDVAGGVYELPVSAEGEVRGCGGEGATIILWAYVGEQFVFSQETLPWPGDGATATFDATFSTADPLGAGTPVTEIKGLLFDTQGRSLPKGSVVEAYVGDTLCGITSMRDPDATEGYYTLIVAGPEAIPACGDGAPITFRIDGKPAAGAAINDLGRSAEEEREVNLTLQ